MLIDAIPGFEFPRKVLSYHLDHQILDDAHDGNLYWNEIPLSHFIFGNTNFDEEWHPLSEEYNDNNFEELYWNSIKNKNMPSQKVSNSTLFDDTWNPIGSSFGDIVNSNFTPVAVDTSYFDADLTDEEINILALLMMRSWLQRQVTSIENIRMKYSGSDFKFTSQANHLAKLMAL